MSDTYTEYLESDIAAAEEISEGPFDMGNIEGEGPEPGEDYPEEDLPDEDIPEEEDEPVGSARSVTEETRRSEAADFRSRHDADRPPSEEEENAAPTRPDPQVAQNFDSMNRIGAEVPGEGRV